MNTASTRIHCEDCDGENKENKVKKENSHKGTVNVEPVSPASQNPQLRDGTDTERFPLVTTATQTSPVRKLLIDQSDSGAIQLAFDPDVKFWAASEYFDVGFSRRTESTSIPKPTSVPLVKQPKSETHVSVKANL